jgi:hypothetical protein
MSHKKIIGQFIPRKIEMLKSTAMQALGLAGHRVLLRLEIEHANHGGKDNGKLPVTFLDFERFGIHREAIAPAIREVCALGFAEVTRPGRSGNGKHRAPNLFRITYLPTGHAAATDCWRRIKSVAEADRIMRRARQKKPRGRKKSAKSTTPGIRTGQGTESVPATTPGIRTKTPHPPPPESVPLSRRRSSHLGLNGLSPNGARVSVTDENSSGPDYERWIDYRRKKEQQHSEPVLFETSKWKINSLNLRLWRLLENEYSARNPEWGALNFLTKAEKEWLQSVDRKKPKLGDHYEALEIERRVGERQNKKRNEQRPERDAPK